MPCDLFHDVSAFVAGIEIAALVNAAWIVAQFRFDGADFFENVRKLDPRKNTQASKSVRRSDSLGRFVRVFVVNNGSERRVPGLLDPSLRRTERAFFIVKLLG